MGKTRLAAIAVFVLAAVALATWWAGEQTEVVRLRTLDADGGPHETKMWVVDHDGATWVRVANPRRGWYQRLVRNPHVHLVRGGSERAMIATPQVTPEAREALDRAFREKYGRTDWWYGVMLRRHPIPVRLDPAPDAPKLP